MNISFTPQAWEDYEYWQKTDKRILKRIHLLIKDIQRASYEGIGKPEALKHNLSGYSLRVDMNLFTLTSITDTKVSFQRNSRPFASASSGYQSLWP